MATQDQQPTMAEQTNLQTDPQPAAAAQPQTDVHAQADAQRAAWNQGVEELTQSARDALGMVGSAVTAGVENAGSVLDAVGPVLEVAGGILEVVGVVAEILDAVTPKS